MLGKMKGVNVMDWTDSRQGPKTGFRENGDEPFGSITATFFIRWTTMNCSKKTLYFEITYHPGTAWDDTNFLNFIKKDNL